MMQLFEQPDEELLRDPMFGTNSNDFLKTEKVVLVILLGM